MLGGVCTDLSVTVVLLFLTVSGTQSGALDDFSSIILPQRANSEYVTQCSITTGDAWVCDWTRTQRTTGDATLSLFKSNPLEIEGDACLEFWYLAPATATGSELGVSLKSSSGLRKVWASPSSPKVAWRQVFVPLSLTEQGTQVLFEAVQAHTAEDIVKFKQIGVRKGSCGPQCEPATEFWTDEFTQCNCPSGELICFPSRCAEGQSCGPRRGASNPVTANGMCTIHSHTDCSTFDGVLFRFMAPCTYVLAQTCSPTEGLPVFRVTVVNKQNDKASLPFVQRIYVDMDDIRVTLLRQQTQRVVVNGVWKKLPLTLGNDTIHINSNPAAVALETSFGLSISYDKAGAVQVSLLSEYMDQVCGMCGNFNNRIEDDFQQPDGSAAEDATALAKSWETAASDSSCETLLVPHRCEPGDKAIYASEMYCGGLLSSSGPFSQCLSVVGAESYYRACMFGMCASHGDPGVLCDILEDYAGICQEAAVTVSNWRNSTSCSPQCGANSHYNSCADGCPEVCSSWEPIGSCGSCEERCECDPGFKLSGGTCVPAEDCGCWNGGKHYDKGETVILGDCEQQCECMGDDVVRCTQMQCQDNELCKVKGGIKGCFPFQPVTCSVYGDPHFITFDKWTYNFQGGCSYTLTTTCAEHSSVHFSVIGHNALQPIHNFTRSKLEAVTLQIGDRDLTLHQSGRVYVNNSDVPLPYSTTGSFGSVKVDRRSKHIILEATFGLRMMIDGENRLFLQVDEHLKYELCGLCGTYSGHQDDDFVTPGGENVTDSFEFGDSWRVAGNTECVAQPSHPRLCDDAENNKAYHECTALFAEGFSACHEHIHPSVYLSSCVYDYCSTNGDRRTFCDSLKSYVAACQVARVNLFHWETGTVCDASTTPSPTYPSLISTQDETGCSLDCSFDSGLCEWNQMITDSFDWTWQSGSTPTLMTGPSADHTGDGHYLYIEASSVTHGDTARLISTECSNTGPQCLQFWFHMYGSADTMGLHVYLLQNKSTNAVFWRRNNQGNSWHLAQVDIQTVGPFQIFFEGRRGSNEQSDVAIDDVKLYQSPCSDVSDVVTTVASRPISSSAAAPPSVPAPSIAPSVLPTTISTQPSTCGLQCDFDEDLCQWNQLVTDVFDWTRQRGSTQTITTGPSADHTTGDGYYLYIEGNSASYGDTARLISTECSDTGPQCLQFWYHMYGSADTMALNVYVVQNRRTEAVWWKRNDQGNKWHLGQVEIQTTTAFQIIFEGRIGSNEHSDVAIDDVALHHGFCADPTTTARPPQTTIQPEPPTTFYPEPTTAGPPQTTIQPEPPTTFYPEPTTAGPQPPTTFYPEPTTAPPQPATTFYPEPTTAPPQPATTFYPEPTTTAGPLPPTTFYPEPTTAGPQPPTTFYPEPTTAPSQPPTTFYPEPTTTAGPLPPTTFYPEPTTAGPLPPTTFYPDPTTAGPLPPTTFYPEPTTAGPQPPTTFYPEPTTAGPLPPTTFYPDPTTAGPLPPTTFYPDPTTARPQPPTTFYPEPTTAGPLPPTTFYPDPTTAPPQPPTTFYPDPTTAGPLPPTTFYPDPTTARPQPPTTFYPEPTTAGPLPPTTFYPEPTTAGPQPPTTFYPEPTTTAGPLPPTTFYPEPTTTGPQPPTTFYPEPTTAPPQPATTFYPEPTTAGPQPPTTFYPDPTTARPQPPTTFYPEPTTAGPLPPTTFYPDPTTAPPQPPTTFYPEPTTAGPLPPTTFYPEPTTAGPQPPTTFYPEPTTAGPLPPTTFYPDPTTASPQPATTFYPEPTTAGPLPPTTFYPEPTTTAGPLPPTTFYPEPTTAPPQPATTFYPEPTTAGPQPPTTFYPEPTTAGPRPPTTFYPEPTTAGPRPPTTFYPEPTTAGPLPPTTFYPEPTTAGPLPPTTFYPEPTTAGPQPPTTFYPEPTTTAGPQPTTTFYPEPTTTARPQPTTTFYPEPTTTARPQPTTTFYPEPTTTAGPEPTTTAGPQPPTTFYPEPTTTAGPQPTTTFYPEPTTTARPQPPTTFYPEPTTTARPQTTTTFYPEPTTTAGPEPTTTAGPQPPTTPQPDTTTTRPQPTPTAPSCPRNSHYTSCMPSCSPTCEFLNGRPDCNENQSPCVAGCVCDDGFVKIWRGICVPIQLCGCVDDNGDRYHFDEVWYTSHCKQKCECERNRGRGRIDCNDQDECDGNTVCLQNQNGKYHCNETQGFGKCTIDEDSEYKTFDKKKYTFDGEHTYVLVRSKESTGDLPDFYIEGRYHPIPDDDRSSEERHRHRHSDEDEEDEEDDDSDEQKHHRLQELRIRVYNLTVALQSRGQITVNGKRTRTPVSPTEGLTIWKDSSRLHLKTEFGLSVEFDDNYEAEIILPRLYEARVEGLCGNFDRQKYNDWMKPDGTLAEDSEDFEESWRV